MLRHCRQCCWHAEEEERGDMLCVSTVGWLGGVALSTLFLVVLVLNEPEPNHKGKSLAAVAWLKQSDCQGRGFGVCR